MSQPSPQHPVVVGADGTVAGLRAVRYAALEAVRLGAALRILHVTPAYTPSGPSLPMVPDATLRAYGHKVLVQAGAEAHSVAPHLDVSTQMLTGGRAATLVHHAEQAPLLVLGNERRSLAERVWTGATVVGVAARAHCPVVVVPPEWDHTLETTRHPVGERGPVVVGYKSPHHSAELFGAAFALARARETGVEVLHAWKLMSGYDDIVSTRTAADEWAAKEREAIEPLLEDFRRSYPEVPVRVRVRHDQAAHALVRASAGADRLLITRPVHGGYFHHLGSVARAVLREGTCPVEVVPPVNVGADAAGLELERGGALQR